MRLDVQAIREAALADVERSGLRLRGDDELISLCDRVESLEKALKAIIEAEKIYDLRKYDCPSAPLLWAIEEAEEALK